MVAPQDTVQGPSSIGYRVGEFFLDIDRKELSKNGTTVSLRPQSFDAFVHLVRNSGRLVSKQDLIRKIWGNKAVSEDSLTHCIIDIRKALDDVDRELVRTVPRRGFVLELPVDAVMPHAVSLMKWRVPRRPFALAGVIALAIVTLLAAFHFGAQTNNTEPHRSLATDYGAEATDKYLQARFLFNRRAPGDLQSARDLFLMIVRHEPAFAEAWAGLAGTYAIEYSSGGYEDARLLEQQRRAAERSVAIDPDLAEGLVRLSFYYLSIGEAEMAEEHLDRAYAADPDDLLLLGVMAGRYAQDGDLGRAIQLQQRALHLDPLSLVVRSNLAYYLYASGRYEEAMTEDRRVQQLSPPMASKRNPLDGWILIQMQKYREARAAIERWPENAAKHAATAMVALKLGNSELANAKLTLLRDASDLDAYVRLAELFAFCEEPDRSFAALSELARAAGNDKLVLERYGILDDINLSPFLAPLRADQRWDVWLSGETVASAKLPDRTTPAR